jgi:beta-N-acetylhexosaminidase
MMPAFTSRVIGVLKIRGVTPLACRSCRSRMLSIAWWLVGGSGAAVWMFAAMNLRSPYLLPMRSAAPWIWMAAGLLAAGWLCFRGRRGFSRLLPVHLIACVALLSGIVAGRGHWLHIQNRKTVMDTPSERMPEVGKHLIIGWLGFEEMRVLAAKGGIAGIFLTSHDFRHGVTVGEIRRTVDTLQSARREAGLPQLWIATDQEGGLVEKLSPPVPEQAALGSLLLNLDGPGLAADPERSAEIVRLVTDYAEVQGRALAEAGINLNFSPVVDLRPATPPDVLDLHSRIASRALAADPATVALAGETYVRTLAKHGITSVLKHFPGLGRVSADTHHFAASLTEAPAVLHATDWLPFREISGNTGAGIMLGHVRLASLDPEHPASCSSAVMRGLLRNQWGVTGLLVTDDFSMTPIFHRPGGIVRAARTSMAAGVDLILLSYDAEAVYDLLADGLANAAAH